MSKGSVNKAILIGNLGQDPDLRYLESGQAVCRLSLATTDTWKDRHSGETQERTEWHRVVLFGKLGEIAGQYLSKGAKAYIEGRIETRKWQKDGQDRYTTEIVADAMQMLGDKRVPQGGASEAAGEPGRAAAYGDRDIPF